MYIINKGSWHKSSSGFTDSIDLKVCMINADEISQLDQIYKLDNNNILKCLQRKAFTFDHHDSIDYIGVLFLDKSNLIEQHEMIEDEIALLENAFLTDRKNNCSHCHISAINTYCRLVWHEFENA